MVTRVGINGFGRIGRQSLRAILERHPDDLEVVAVNDITDAETNAHLLRYDSTYGRFPGTVEVGENNLIINGKRIMAFAQRDPGQIPWGDVHAQIIIESTDHFTVASKARTHLHETVRKVIISAPLPSPATGQDATIVLGVNEQTYDPTRHHIISNASCTTNCLAPTVKVLHDTFGVEQGLMTTVHASSRLVLRSQSTEQFVSGLQKNYAPWSEHWTKDTLPEIVESTLSYRWSTAQGV